MSTVTVMAITAAAMVGCGLHGLIVHSRILRRIVALNVMGSGIFLLFGVIARRGASEGLGSDPVPQAMVITGIVVAFAGTALAVALARRFAELSQEGGEAGGEAGGHDGGHHGGQDLPDEPLELSAVGGQPPEGDQN